MVFSRQCKAQWGATETKEREGVRRRRRERDVEGRRAWSLSLGDREAESCPCRWRQGAQQCPGLGNTQVPAGCSAKRRARTP